MSISPSHLFSATLAGNYWSATGRGVITIDEDHFHFDSASRRMHLEEPATLFADAIARTDVHAYRVKNGWQLMTTVYDEDDLSLVDLWSHTGLPGVSTPAD